MENQENSSKRSPKSGLISFFTGLKPSEVNSTFIPPFSLSGWIFFLSGFIPSLIVGWFIFPMVLYSEQPQPINFSHVIHMDPEKVDSVEGETEIERCQFCHAFYDDGTFVGFPRLEKCMECHDDPDSPLGEAPEEEEFLAEYAAHEKEIPWFSYSRQPDNVYFSHIPHVNMAKKDCQTCHGDHNKSDKLPVYKENRLTGYSINIYGKRISGYKKNTWDRLKMDDCAECHTKEGKEENNACFVCHK